MYLIALLAVTFNWPILLMILEVAFGLGMVIFVHELGHFAVAKWCGVKCEKFYLGFDIYGLKLFKYRYGETEYGIGILPLGGYVKMLGQDDNPSRASQERERSTLHIPSGDLPAEPMAGPHGEPPAPPLDPRSYLAKSVPQRMAIISAGVIMNVIFAFVMAACAYWIGVQDVACGISAVLPGEAAWRADLRPGDSIVQIDRSGSRQLRFRDLMSAVALADMENGIDFQISRPGVPEPFWVNVKPDPDKRRLRPTIGVVQPRTSQLSEQKPVVADTPAAAANEFKPSDKIVAVAGEKIETYANLLRVLARHAGETLRFTVERTAEGDKVENVEIEVAPRLVRDLGLVMAMGPITAVQNHSPAAEAGIHAGDVIESIDGAAPSDPLRLPESLRKKAGQAVQLVVRRENETLTREIKVREVSWPEESEVPGSPVSIPALGLTYSLTGTIERTDPNGPAHDAQLSRGDTIVQAEFVLPKNALEKESAEESTEVTLSQVPEAVPISEDRENWPFFVNQLQWMPPGTQVKLTLADKRVVMITPRESSDWFYADRGLVNGLEMTTTRAHTLAEAISLGGFETRESVMQVYSFIRKIGSQISPFVLGGPKTIAVAAGDAASQGVSQFMIFLTLLSANLAVINFLPIPLLDGGHMVFLILEGILRRPVNERVVVAFHYLGFVFIISLMLFVLGLDFGLIPRPH